MKKRIFLALIAVLLLACIIGVVSASADDAQYEVQTSAVSEPELKFYGATLVLNNSVEIRYIANVKNVSNVNDLKLLVWLDPQTEYKKGTERYVVDYAGKTMAVSGVSYPCFDFQNAGAKRMTDNFYAVLYIKTDSGEYYSTPAKYSVLNYAYSKLGKTGTATTDSKLKKLLENLLAYGASAQEYQNYKTDRLPTDDFYQVKVSGGTISDGSSNGLYLEGESVTISAAPTIADGKIFAYWQNSAGTAVSKNTSYTLTVGTKNEIYTAVYECNHQGAWVTEKAATCNSTGVEKRICTVCSEVSTREIPIDQSAHKMGSWSVSVAATCTTSGIEKRVCQNGCGKTDTKTVSATGHNLNSSYVYNSTEHWHNCLNDGCTHTTDKGAHIFNNVSCTVCGASKWGSIGNEADTPVIPLTP